MRPLLEVQQTQKAAAGNNWRDLLFPVVSEKSIVLSWAVLELSCGPTDMEMYPLRVVDPFPCR